MIEKCFKVNIRIFKKDGVYYRSGRIIVRDGILQGYLHTGNYINSIKTKSEIRIYEDSKDSGYTIQLDKTIIGVGQYKGKMKKEKQF